MEPRPSERGNGVILADTLTTYTGLQWSHVLPNVETATAYSALPTRPDRFNGATSFRTWKRRWKNTMRKPGACSFNGATSFRTWKREFLSEHLLGRPAASMEPRPSERGNGPSL